MTVLKEMKIVRYLESDFTNERTVPDFSGFDNRIAEAKKWWGMEKRWFFEKTWFEKKGGNRTIYEDMVKVFFWTTFMYLRHSSSFHMRHFRRNLNRLHGGNKQRKSTYQRVLGILSHSTTLGLKLTLIHHFSFKY